MKYNKLVRDRTPEMIKGDGGDPKFHIATDEEYWVELKEKLLEEVGEFLRSENEKELADVVEVIEAIVKTGRVNEQKLVAEISKKAKEKGRFEKRIILEEA